MAQLSFSNLSSQSGYKPLNLALNNKLNPQPLMPVKQQGAGNSFTGKNNATPIGNIIPLASKPEDKPADATPSTGVTSDHISGLIKTVGDLQKNVMSYANQQNQQTPPAAAPEPKPLSNNQNLINQGVDSLTQAARLSRQMNRTINNITTDPNYSLDTQVGRAGIVQKDIGDQISGLSQEGAAAFQGAGYTQPVTQFGQLTNPQTGEVIGAGSSGNNPQLDSAVQRAIQIAQTAGPSAALATLTGYGQAGANAFNQAMLQANPSYNPVASDTSANTNAAQGAQYQQAATQLDTSLKQYGNVATIAKNFLSSNPGINPSDVPKFNQSTQTWQSNITDTGALAQYNLIVNDADALRAAVLQGISNGGLTPTATSQQTLSTDPRSLSLNQLTGWLDQVKQLGDSNLSVLQGQTTNSYGNTTPNPYSGSPTTANTNTPTVPGNTTAGITPNTVGQAAYGAGMSAASSGVSALQNLGGELIGYFAKGLLTP